MAEMALASLVSASPAAQRLLHETIRAKSTINADALAAILKWALAWRPVMRL